MSSFLRFLTRQRSVQNAAVAATVAASAWVGIGTTSGSQGWMQAESPTTKTETETETTTTIDAALANSNPNVKEHVSSVGLPGSETSACDDGNKENTKHAGKCLAGELALFFNYATQDKIQEFFKFEYRHLHLKKALISPRLADRLKKFEGCEVEVAIGRYVDDSQRQILELTLVHPEEVGETSTVGQEEKMFLILTSRDGTTPDDLERPFAMAETFLGPLASTTSSWTGEIPSKEAEDSKTYTYRKTIPYVMQATLATDDSWDPKTNAASCECPGLVEIEKPPQCGFCRIMKEGPCSFTFQDWEHCTKEHRDDEDYVEKCGTKTMMALQKCTEKREDYYGFLKEVNSKATDGDKEKKEEE